MAANDTSVGVCAEDGIERNGKVRLIPAFPDAEIIAG